MTEEPLRPREAAARLRMAPNTLRVYSARLAPLLSPQAARPAAGRRGRPGHRLYAAQDLAILGRARDLVARGRTYDQALAELRGSASAPSAQPRIDLAAVPPDLAGHLATLQQAVDAWRSLAEERAREVEELRRRLETALGELHEERRRRLAAEELIRLAAGEAKGGKGGRSTAQGSLLARLFAHQAEERSPRRTSRTS